MTKLNINSALLIAFVFIATASVSNCQRGQVIGTGLTCSNPSPSILRPALSGANVTLSCNNSSIANATTNANGDFNITVPTVPPLFPINCRVFVTVPANCTIPRLFAPPVRRLGSVVILRVPFLTNVFQAIGFVAA